MKPEKINIITTQTDATISYSCEQGITSTITLKIEDGNIFSKTSSDAETIFNVTGLKPNTAYPFSIFFTDDVEEETGEYTLTTLAEVKKLEPPTNVKVTVDGKTATIKFDCPYKVDIDKFWVNGQGTYDETTSDKGFFIDGLEYGTTYHFKLRCKDNEGNVAESEVYSFETAKIVKPVAPEKIVVTVFKNNAEINFTKQDGCKTQLILDGVEKETTSDSVFYLNNLPWGKKYSFVLRVMNILDEYVDSAAKTFVVAVLVPPVKITGITSTVFKNSAEIHFTKVTGCKTELWIDGVKKDYTVSNVFYLNKLDYGKTYKFVLRAVNAMDQYVDSDENSFTITEDVIPTPPTSVSIKVEDNTATINFVKGKGQTTQVAKSWDKGLEDYSEYTSDSGFFFNNLEFGKSYTFRLRSATSLRFSEYVEYTFETKAVVKPIAPANIKHIVIGNKVEIDFDKAADCKTQLFINGVLNQTVATDSAFYVDSLEWDKTYTYKLVSINKINETAESAEFTFKTESNAKPTVATDIAITVFKNGADINFTKGNCSKTVLLLDGVQVDSTVSDSTFYLHELEWGKTYTVVLRSLNAVGDYVDSESKSFSIAKVEVPTVATNITHTVFNENIEIHFTKGTATKTELWIDSEFNQYTVSDDVFYVNGLSIGEHTYKLVSVNAIDESVSTEEIKFTIK